MAIKTSDDITDTMKRVAAMKQGYKFIELRLNPEKVRTSQQQVRITGVKCANAYSAGLAKNGIRQYDIVKQGGHLVFKLDLEEGEYKGWLYDDEEKGPYSEIGYNRDVLASHYHEDRFIIVDPKIRKDVEKRAKLVKKHISESLAEKEEAKPMNSVEDIDAQIEMLQQQKQALTEMKKEESVA